MWLKSGVAMAVASSYSSDSTPSLETSICSARAHTHTHTHLHPPMLGKSAGKAAKDNRTPGEGPGDREEICDKPKWIPVKIKLFLPAIILQHTLWKCWCT